MASKDGLMFAILLVLAVEAFAVWLETRWERRASERGEWHLARLLEYVEALPRPHASMYVPAVVTPAADPHAVQDPRQRRVVDVTRDEEPSSAPTIEVTGEEPLPREAAPRSARMQARLEAPTLPSFRAVPALGEDEEDGDTRIITRVGPPPVRKW